MSRQLDTDLINKRAREKEQIIQDGRFIEGITANGDTPEYIVNKAKKELGIKENDSIMISFSEKLKSLALETKAFISLANFTSKAEDTGMLTEEELSSIKVIESKLAKIIGEKYDISMDDLYQEGE